MLARRCTLYYLKNCLKQLDFIAQMLSMKQIFFCMLYLLSFSANANVVDACLPFK